MFANLFGVGDRTYFESVEEASTAPKVDFEN